MVRCLTPFKFGNRFRLGAGWMVVSTLFASLMGVASKLGMKRFTLGAYELTFWYGVVGLVVVGFFIYWRHGTLKTRFASDYVWRGIFGYLATLTGIYAFMMLPLSVAIVLSLTFPIFVALISYLQLGEYLTKRIVFAVLVGFVGVVVLLYHEWIEQCLALYLLNQDVATHNPISLISNQNNSPSRGIFPYLVGLGCGLFTGWARVYMSVLCQKRGEPVDRVVFYFLLACTLFSIPCVSLFETWHLPTWTIPIGTTSNQFGSAWILVGLGLCGLLKHSTMTIAYAVANRILVSNLGYVAVIITSFIDIFFFHESITVIMVLAMLLVVMSGVIMTGVRK